MRFSNNKKRARQVADYEGETSDDEYVYDNSDAGSDEDYDSIGDEDIDETWASSPRRSRSSNRKSCRKTSACSKTKRRSPSSSDRRSCNRWTEEQKELLLKAVEIHGPKNWKDIAKMVGHGKKASQCHQEYTRVLAPNINKAPWTQEELQRLVQLVKQFGTASWKRVAEKLEGRIDIQCRQRWQTIRKTLSSKELKEIEATTQIQASLARIRRSDTNHLAIHSTEHSEATHEAATKSDPIMAESEELTAGVIDISDATNELDATTDTSNSQPHQATNHEVHELDGDELGCIIEEKNNIEPVVSNNFHFDLFDCDLPPACPTIIDRDSYDYQDEADNHRHLVFSTTTTVADDDDDDLKPPSDASTCCWSSQSQGSSSTDGPGFLPAIWLDGEPPLPDASQESTIYSLGALSDYHCSHQEYDSGTLMQEGLEPLLVVLDIPEECSSGGVHLSFGALIDNPYGDRAVLTEETDLDSCNYY